MLTTATIHSACLAGLDVMPLTVDVNISPGLPQITLVGVAGADTHEAASRVRCAIKASGFEIPQRRIVVQVSPSTIRPRGTQLDLAIAVAILAATGQVVVPTDALFVGELALDGRVLPVRGLACYAAFAADHDMTLVCPTSIEPLSFVPVDTLDDLRTLGCRHLTHNSAIAPVSFGPQDLPDEVVSAANRAMGHHGILLLRGADGPVSHVAIALQRSLAPLNQAQCDELKLIHSACHDGRFAGEPPFRCPHHSITMSGMVGGGRPVMPGEVTLATHGVLLLSDIECWSQIQLQALSTALADGVSRIVRAEGIWVMPAAPALIIATTTDTRTPADQLLRSLAKVGFEEVSL